MDQWSDTYRCRALVCGVERSSYQPNVAPKDDPHRLLDSARGALVHTGHGRIKITGDSPGVGVDDLSHTHTQASRQGHAPRPVSEGMWTNTGVSTLEHGTLTYLAGHVPSVTNVHS